MSSASWTGRSLQDQWAIEDRADRLRDPQKYIDMENAKKAQSAPMPTALQTGAYGSGVGGGVGMSPGGGSNSSALFQQAAATADPWAPQREKYTTALNQLMQGGESAIAADPSFQSRMKMGQDSLARSAAAKGFLGSGNILQETAKYGQDLASQEYGNQFNRLSQLAGVTAGSPTAAGNIMAQMPGQNLAEQQTGFNQAVTAQKLPYELTALQQGSQLGAQNVASGDIQQQLLQQQLQANKDAQNRLSMVQNLSRNQYPTGMFG